MAAVDVRLLRVERLTVGAIHFGARRQLLCELHLRFPARISTLVVVPPSDTRSQNGGLRPAHATGLRTAVVISPALPRCRPTAVLGGRSCC
jgi:hypothetical protein